MRDRHGLARILTIFLWNLWCDLGGGMSLAGEKEEEKISEVKWGKL